MQRCERGGRAASRQDARGWGGIMGLEILTLQERPDLRPLIFASDLQSVWPEFMRHDAAANLYFAPSMFDRYLDYAFAGVVDGKVVARAFSVPFAFGRSIREERRPHGFLLCSSR